MVEWLREIYGDPMFLLFPVATSLVSVGAFALFAIPFTWIAWRDPESLRHRRIQNRPVKGRDIVRRSVVVWLANNAFTFVVVVLAWPLLRHTGVHAGALPPAWVIAAQLLLFIYLDDFLYYWMHRAMHRGWLYKRIHSVHHRIITPWAITGHYMHPVEYLLTATLTLVGPMLVGAHVVTLWIWVAFRQWEAAEGHSGYDFPWTPTHFLPGGDGAVHHDFHHARVRGNYAGFLSHMDRLLGTCAKGYAEDRARRRGLATAGGA